MTRLLIFAAALAAATAQYAAPYAAYGGWNSAWNTPTAYSGAWAAPAAYNGAWAAPAAYNGAWAAPAAYSAAWAGPAAYSAAAAPLTYAAPAPVAAPFSYSRRYRTQDELGQATYGHEEATQNQAAVRDAFGNVAGSYNYINPEGKVIAVKYTAGVNGVQVKSNALPVAPIDTNQPPVDTNQPPMPVQVTPEVAQATAEHMQAVAAAKSKDAQTADRRKRALLTPTVYAAAPAGAGYPAELTETILNPGHATAYRVEPLAPTLLLRRRRALLASPIAYAAAPASAGYPAELTETILNPGHATAYRVDPLF